MLRGSAAADTVHTSIHPTISCVWRWLCGVWLSAVAAAMPLQSSGMASVSKSWDLAVMVKASAGVGREVVFSSIDRAEREPLKAFLTVSSRDTTSSSGGTLATPSAIATLLIDVPCGLHRLLRVCGGGGGGVGGAGEGRVRG